MKTQPLINLKNYKSILPTVTLLASVKFDFRKGVYIIHWIEMTHTFTSLKTIPQEIVRAYGCLKSHKSEVTPIGNQTTSLKGMGWPTISWTSPSQE